MELTELAANYFGNTRDGSLAGPIGAFLIAALAVTMVLLIRNMNARIRRLPERFERSEPTVDGSGDSSLSVTPGEPKSRNG
ncbi:hypothetical protein JQS43_20750 [Natronosporangium hydrolyticum]|uniref:Uncharacterized protein n=1 Tax=Natronosporangium hydrolyticum TaxID=2811111 RepID=A0A895YEW0_9ACTN|nr:hypothetical protein [Natronosporangium hydrolyticum]QSB13949.1 hypothetical protein JQS43_20750 [Natronosporangium hydrolyticum]